MVRPFRLERFDRAGPETVVAREADDSLEPAGRPAQEPLPLSAPDEGATNEDPGRQAAEALTEIASLLDRLLTERTALRREVETGVAERFGRAAAAALPTVARENFAAEVAAATRDLLGAGGPEAARLRVSPQDLDAIEDCLRAQAEGPGPGEPPAPGAAPVSVPPLVSDPALETGNVAIDWDGGGAVIEAERLAEIARSVLAAHDMQEFTQETAQ